MSESGRRALMRAGARSIMFNAPMGVERGEALADFCASNGTSVLDVGCGHGELALLIADRHPHLEVSGLDIDPEAVAGAQQRVEARGLADRVTISVGDGAEWSEAADTAVCIGASHALGGTASMFGRLLPLGRRAAVVGEGFWTSSPSEELLDIFGDQPDGIAGLGELATSASWSLVAADASTLDEWDAFENGWTAGVRAVGSPEAIAFADERAAEYPAYRGVLGFGWLHLTR
ncbi:MAG: SAM-dependent methyltransferase [Acidimicrobiales bacterium]